MFCLVLPVNPAFGEVDWQAKTNLQWSQQSFIEGPAQQQTQLQLSSLWRDDSWDIRLALPLIAMDSAYQLNPGKTPNLCARIQRASQQKLARWLRLERVTQKTIDRCLAQPDASDAESVSGAGDATVEANYYWPLNDNVEVSLGAGFKAANADAEQNLGTGRESVYLMTGATYLWSEISAGINGEFTRQLGTASPDERDNTASVSAQINWQWREDLSLGVFSHWDSASFSDEDNLLSTGLNLSYQPIKRLTLGLSVERYRTNSQDLTKVVMGQIAYTGF
ncbi:MAG: hypothetical protein EOO68_31880 [Moraxellaceae bacterium]|nr:MAG: hypothetical protein EOO68_31880 [Moraxellaceae bacterium]